MYERYDALGGGPGFEERRADLLRALGGGAQAEPTSRASRPTISRRRPVPRRSRPSCAPAGAFRADVSGAGPAVYGLFQSRAEARSAARRLGRRTRTWMAAAVW